MHLEYNAWQYDIKLTQPIPTKQKKKKKKKKLGLNVWMHEKHEKEGFRPHTNKLKLDIVPK